MWQMKENKIPYSSIHDIETIIWNVVKNNLRPDTCPSVEAQKSPQLSCYQPNKIFDKRKPFNENVPRIVVEKSSHKKLRVTKNKRKVLQRRKLFDSNVDDDEDDGQEMYDLFIDRRELESEIVSLVEDNFVKLFQKCWSQDDTQRSSASTVRDTLQYLIDLL